MGNTTLILVVVVLLVILLLYKKPKAENASLASRLVDQSQNVNKAFQADIGPHDPLEHLKVPPDPYKAVQTALEKRRFEYMSSSKKNTDEPLENALHGHSALNGL